MDDGSNLNDFAIFVRVVEHGGFAAAARALRAPKSTLSKRVAELEASLGVRLLERTSRRFVVTEAGRDFHRHAAAMLIEAENARSVVLGRLAEPGGTVRLTASLPTAQLFLAGMLPDLVRRWPKLRLMVNATDRFVDLVRDGFDLGIRDHFAPLEDSDLVQRTLQYQPSVLVAAPRYLERHGTPDEPTELAAHDGLLSGPLDAPCRLTHVRGRTAELSIQPRLFADERLVLLEAASAALGIACLPSQLCAERLHAGALVRVLPDWTADGVTSTLLMPPRRAELPAVRAVADFLIERFRATETSLTLNPSRSRSF